MDGTVEQPYTTIQGSGGFEISSNFADPATVQTSMDGAKAKEAAKETPKESKIKTEAEPLESKGKAVEESVEKAPEKPKEGRERDEQGKFKGKPKAEPEGTEGESDQSNPSPVETPEPKKERKGDPRHDPRARVEQATAQAAEWRRRAEEADNRLNMILQAVEQERQAASRPATQPGVDPDAPQREQFESDSDFIRAEAKYEARKEAAEQFRSYREHEARAAYEAQAERSRNQAFTGFKERIDKAGGRDFLDNLSEEVLNLRPLSALAPGERPSPMNAIAEQIIRSDFSTGLMQYFSENPGELQRLPTLHPQDAMRAIGRIEARFENAVSAGPTTRTRSKAPAPVQPVAGSATITDDPNGMDLDTYARKQGLKPVR